LENTETNRGPYMTIYDDLCDWCGGYVDPIGGDMAKAFGRKLWCGLCVRVDKQRDR